MKVERLRTFSILHKLMRHTSAAVAATSAAAPARPCEPGRLPDIVARRKPCRGRAHTRKMATGTKLGWFMLLAHWPQSPRAAPSLPRRLDDIDPASRAASARSGPQPAESVANSPARVYLRPAAAAARDAGRFVLVQRFKKPRQKPGRDDAGRTAAAWPTGAMRAARPCGLRARRML